jgi:hypothetical protein
MLTLKPLKQPITETAQYSRKCLPGLLKLSSEILAMMCQWKRRIFSRQHVIIAYMYIVLIFTLLMLKH